MVDFYNKQFSSASSRKANQVLAMEQPYSVASDDNEALQVRPVT